MKVPNSHWPQTTIKFVVLCFTMRDQFVSIYTKLKFHHKINIILRKFDVNFMESSTLSVLSVSGLTFSEKLMFKTHNFFTQFGHYTPHDYTIISFFILYPHNHQQTLWIFESTTYVFKHLPQYSIVYWYLLSYDFLEWFHKLSLPLGYATSGYNRF